MGRRHPCTQQRGLLTLLMVLALIHQQESCPACRRAVAVAKAAAVQCQHCSTTFRPRGGSSSEHPVDSVCPQAAPVLQFCVLHAEHPPTHVCRAAAALPYPEAPTSTAASPPWHHSIASLLPAGGNAEHSSPSLAPTCSTALLSPDGSGEHGRSNAPRTASELQHRLSVDGRQQRRMAPHALPVRPHRFSESSWKLTENHEKPTTKLHLMPRCEDCSGSKDYAMPHVPKSNAAA